MKLSVETYLLRNKYGDQKAFAMLHEAGFDAVDYSFYWHEDPWFMREHSREHAAQLRTWLEEYGMCCVQAHAPFDMLWGEDFDLSNPHYLLTVKAIEGAALLGAKCIVVHALDKAVETPLEETVEMNYRYYKSLEPWAAKFGIQIAVENLFLYDLKRKRCAGLFGSPDALCAMLRKLDSPWFTACVDVGHASLSGWEPEDFIRRMDPQFLGALHIQDTDYLDDRHTLPYLGDFKWEAIMAALREKNFRGGINLEIFLYMERFPEALLPDALAMAAKVGRHLMAQLEE